MATEMELIPTRISHFPELSAELLPIDAPVREVTLLEDRAQIRRSGRVTLRPGRNRLVIRDVAPVLQDVSLRGALSGDGRVIDLCARRAVRVRAIDKPERARQLEEEIEKLRAQHEDLAEERGRAEQRHRALSDILSKGTSEIPEDAAWGMVNQQAWHDTFETLYKRARGLVDTIVERYRAQLEIVDQVNRLAAERRAIDRWDHAFVAWIEVDLEASAPGEHELSVEYVVPNALWRPLHTARLGADGRVRFRCCAAVWQNTGEDWQNAGLTFSTARASLGTEPPLLSDDLLQAQRKSERVVVEQRQVAVQRASVGGGGPSAETSQAVDLPGVDDGGDIQNLRASSASSIPSDGRLNVIPVFEFETPADRELICVPELEPRVFLKATFSNGARHPILAGPVELIRESGVVGWTKVLFVAPGEKLELSFGHDDGLRVYRTTRGKSETDEVDRWTHNDTTVVIFLSNLEGEAKQIELVERIPVAEIEHVRVKILAEKCQPPPPTPDKDGFCRYRFSIPANAHQTLQLRWRLSTAPGVEGI